MMVHESPILVTETKQTDIIACVHTNLCLVCIDGGPGRIIRNDNKALIRTGSALDMTHIGRERCLKIVQVWLMTKTKMIIIIIGLLKLCRVNHNLNYDTVLGVLSGMIHTNTGTNTCSV